METAKGHIAKHTPSSKTTQTTSQQATPTIVNNTTANNTTTKPTTTSTKQATEDSNLPQNFSPLEAWYRYVKKTIGTYGFLDNTDLESSLKFAETIKNGCYFCSLNNPTHQQCGPLNEYKRLALVAKESTYASTVSTRANQTKDEHSVTYDVDKDNISSNNVTTYVVRSLDKNNIISNIFFSNKPANYYCTSPINKIEYVEDRKSNIFTSSKVNNFSTSSPILNHTQPSKINNKYSTTQQNQDIQ